MLCAAPCGDRLPFTCEHVDHLTIGVLPDEVLLEIFGFYVYEVDHEAEWETLVHVCRRWRCVVFGSPHRLGLRLICTEGTPTRKKLDIWPASLPIVISISRLDTTMEDDLIAAFEQTNRICEIRANIVSTDGLEILAELTQNQFPSLTNLDILLSFHHGELVLPDSFLGGSASSLKSLYLKSIGLHTFPSPKLLLSATNLNRLLLEDIPFFGYISPETMIECLSLMVKLEELEIQFRHSRPPSRPRLPSRPLPPYIILPVLTTLTFKGLREYLYQIFSHINAPLLDSVKIELFYSAALSIPQISPFIGRTGTFEAFKHAHMLLRHDLLLISLSSQAGATGGRTLLMSVKCRHSVWRLQSLTHSYGPPPLTNFNPPEGSLPRWGIRMLDSEWLQLLRLFPALETMSISKHLAHRLSMALKGLGEEQVTEILPVLQYLFIDGFAPLIEERIGNFVAARQLSGHPIVVQCWPGENIVQHMHREADD
jgi:hypothetical protein